MVPDAENPSKRSDQGGRRYDFNRTTSRVTCCYCGKSFTPNFNEAIRPVLRHFLPMSFPFAACSTPGCPNFGKNVFEFYGRPHRLYRDRKDRGCEAVCRGCQKGVVLGEPLRLHGSDKMRGILDGVLFAFLLGAKKRRTVHFTQMFFPKVDDKGYYRALRNAGARLRSYHTWRNARLLDPQAPIDFSQTARVYTDVIEASLRRLGDVHRHRRVKIIVSALALEKSYFLLAAHPFFLPRGKEKELAPGNYNIDPATGRPSVEITRKWHCLEHPMHRTITLGKKTTPEDLAAKQADVSRARSGYYIEPAYAELAHFLVVDRMLSRFGRRFYYMDTSRDLFDSAMVAMRDNICRRRVEVVLYQHETGRRRAPMTAGKETKKSRRGRRNAAGLRRAFEEAEAAFEKRINEESLTAPDPERETAPDPEREKVRSVLWRQARVGGNSPFAEGVWLVFPPDYKNYVDCRTFWITRRRDDTVDDGLDLLLNASMHSVDSAHWSMRSRAKALKRRVSTSAGKGLSGSYYRFDVMCAELWVYLLDFNYRLRKRDKRKVPRAVDMGLASASDRVVRLHDVAWNFRLGVAHAKEISRWLSRS